MAKGEFASIGLAADTTTARVAAASRIPVPSPNVDAKTGSAIGSPCWIVTEVEAGSEPLGNSTAAPVIALEGLALICWGLSAEAVISAVTTPPMSCLIATILGTFTSLESLPSDPPELSRQAVTEISQISDIKNHPIKAPFLAYLCRRRALGVA